MSAPQNRKSQIANRKSLGAFTLIELLVVLVIIGLISAVAIPSLSHLMHSNSMSAASRQLLDDLAYARQKAISDHTKVYVVFIPPQFWAATNNNANTTAFLQSQRSLSYSNIYELITGQYTSYALYSERNIGDQPGKTFERYITPWRTLPEGVLIETNKFFGREVIADWTDQPPKRFFDVQPFAWTNLFTFPPKELEFEPPDQRVKFWLPYIGFNSRGGLLPRNGDPKSPAEDEFIPLVRGSIFYPQDNAGVMLDVPDVVEQNYRTPARTNFNIIHIEALTGRARLEKPELK